MQVNRRQFSLAAVAVFASFAISNACAVDTESSPAGDGRLSARPATTPRHPAAASQGATAGTPSADTAASAANRTLGLDRKRDAILRLPPRVTTEPYPLFVMLHGAGGSGEAVLRRVAAAADEAGVAVLAPDSRDSTWDAIRDGFGGDVAFLDRALARVFETVPVDPARIAVGGFFDGATYALSLGLINGDLFRRVVAFSPGFIVDGTPHGKPRFFFSHGTGDPILPIDRCSRVIVPELQRRGFDVTFKEFNGGHQVPAEIAGEAMRWVATP